MRQCRQTPQSGPGCTFLRQFIRYRLFLGCLLLQFIAATSAYAVPLLLQENRSYSLSGYQEMTEDAAADSTFAEVLAGSENRNFRPITQFISRSFGNGASWLRFQLERTPGFPDEAYLRLGPATLDFITVYVQTGENADNPDSYLVYRLGDHIPISQRPLVNPEFIAPLRLRASHPVWVYIRVKSASLRGLTATVDTSASLAAYTNRVLLLQGGWLSISLLIAFLTLILYLRLRDRLYGYYFLYISALFVSRISTTGILPLLWPDKAHLFGDGLVSVGSSLALTFLVLFSLRLFDTLLTRTVRILFRFMIMVTSTAALLAPYVPWDYLSIVLAIGGFILFCILSWISFISAKRGDAGGWLYFGSFLVLLIMFATQILRLQGIAPFGWWTMHAIQIASFVHMLLLSLSLVEKLRCDQQNAITAARNAEHHAEHLAAEMTVELRLKQKALEQALDRQSRFVAMVSHEYRTPLAIIRTNLDLLSLLKEGLDEKIIFAVVKMKRAVSRLVEVLEISLGKARLAEEALRTCLEPVRLQRFVHEVVRQAQDFWPEHDIRFLQTTMDERVILADADLLKTALLNLLDNAVKYSLPNSDVIVRIGIEDKQAVISITDRGIGIPREQLKCVFEKYYRIPGNNAVKGSGVGLYLVDRIVEEHQGAIEIESGTLGTTVTIRLPVVAP
jgi:signal transduction histidine kinase